MDSHQNSQVHRKTSTRDGNAASPNELPLRSSGPFRIAMTYLVLGLLWIWISDFSLVRMDIQSLAAFWAAAGKGSLFVIASSVLVFVLVYRDYATVLNAVNERRTTDEKLRASETRLRLLLKHMPASVAMFDREMRYLYVSRLWLKEFNLEDQDVTGQIHYELFPTMPQRWRETHQRSLAGAIESCHEDQVVLSDGRTQWLRWEVHPWLTADAEIGGIIIFSENITKQKQADEILRASEKRYRQLIHLLPTAIFLQSQEKITFCNHAFLKLIGAEHQDEVLGSSPFDIVHPEYHSLVRDRIARMRETGKHAPEVEMRVVRLDGRQVPVYSIATLVVNAGKAEILVAMTDLSERHHLESQIRQAQRIEAIGRLAGGIAHDFNNLLTVINGYSELLTPGADPTSIEHVAVSAIREAGTRAASLTSQLLTFSRRAIVSPVVLDLNQQLRQSEKLLRCLIGEDILISLSLDPNLGRIKADPGQLDQVVMNLAVNARDAMPTGGQLRIETRATKLNLNGSDEDSVPDSELTAFSELTVSDTGCGIPRENLQAIFDPFFTTKEPGKGTGLGLSVVDGIIRQAGGFILADSEVGKGSLFRIWFPVVNEPVSITETDSSATMSSVIQTILLVEDEAAVRNVVQTGLESFGYRVIVAGSAAEAIQLMQTQGPEIDLLITDVVMPGMSGRQLSDQLRIQYPNLKILFVSGYTDDAVVRHGVEDSSDILLLKPFTPAELAQRIRTLFDDAEQLPTAIEQS
ncbi:MAG: PAS domain S-box protein [Planctomycetaceae bacterium]